MFITQFNEVLRKHYTYAVDFLRKRCTSWIICIHLQISVSAITQFNEWNGTAILASFMWAWSSVFIFRVFLSTFCAFIQFPASSGGQSVQRKERLQRRLDRNERKLAKLEEERRKREQENLVQAQQKVRKSFVCVKILGLSS